MNPDWTRDYSQTETRHLLAMTDSELANIDPLAINLIVAKGIHSLADLDIVYYQATLNSWVEDFRNRCLGEQNGDRSSIDVGGRVK